MSDQPYPMSVGRPVTAQAQHALPPSRPDPFTPRGDMPPSRPIAKVEEGASRGEGWAAIGSGLLVILLAAVVAWTLYLALG